MSRPIRNIWPSWITLNWRSGVFLIVLVCVPRFILVLQANIGGRYQYIGIMMLLSAIIPILLLNKFGLRRIGIRRSSKISKIILAFISGLIASFILFYIGKSLYGNSYQNWYSYIGRSYNISPDLAPDAKRTLFLIMAGTAMIFSPIGEELFFRGIVHTSFRNSWDASRASIVDATAFAVTHIAHFGLVYVQDQWIFLFVPTLIWVVSMFLISMVFIYFKNKCDSLWGAIVCHAAFNLGMVYLIFYHLPPGQF